MMYKKLFLILVLLSSYSSNAVEDESCLQINVSAHPNYPPFHWKEGDQLTGASIEISKRIFESLGVTANVGYQGPWKRVLRTAELGKIDFIPALKNSVERQQYLTFTKTAFSNNPVVVYMRKGESSNINRLSDLSTRLGSINAGDKHGDEIDSFIDQQSNMQHIMGIDHNFDMLSLKRTDYFVIGLFVAEDYIQANDLSEKFEVVLSFEGQLVHNAFTHAYAGKCPHIVEQFDHKLNELKRQGKITSALIEFNRQWLKKSKESR